MFLSARTFINGMALNSNINWKKEKYEKVFVLYIYYLKIKKKH